MMDGEKFFKACFEPFNPAHSNCVTAVAAAIPHGGKTRKAFVYWLSRKEEARRRDAGGTRTARLAELAAEQSRSARTDTEGTAPAWGVASINGRGVVALRIAGAWWVRAYPAGIARLPASAIIRAWEVE